MKITLSQVFIAVVLTSLSYAKAGKAQAMLNKNVTVAINNSSLSKALKQLEKNADVKFVYSKSIIKTNEDVSVNAKDEKLGSVLNRLLIPNGIKYEVVNDRIILVKGGVPLIGSTIAPVTQENAPFANSITGTVVDETSQPLPGVNIRLNSSDKGTSTDVNGAFKIDVDNATDTLTFTFVGYEPQKVVVGTSKSFKIKMVPSVENNLKEVQVIGYGTSVRSNLATAVSTVKGAAINERPTTTNVLQGLAGKVAGVNIMINSGRPGGAPAIKIRGNGSINTSNDPLYVIDGIVGADFNSIDPSIIESVDILKDAASAAIYGSRGANGVVLITTKRGKEGTSVINFNNTVSFGSLQREVKLLNSEEELEMIKRQYAFNNTLAPNIDPSNTFARKADLFNSDGSPKYHTDWQKEATHLAISDTHNLTFSGGKDGLTVLANVAFRNQEGIVLNTYSKQLIGFLNIGWDVKPWLHLDARINSGASQGNNEYNDVFGLTPLREMYEMWSFLPVMYPDGTYSMKGDFPGSEQSENPVKLLNSIQNITGKTFSQANFGGTFHLSKKLDFVTTFSGSTEGDYAFYYADNDVFSVSQTQNGIARRAHVDAAAWTNEDYFSYKNDFGKHHLEAIAGASWYYNISTTTSTETDDFFDNFYKFNNLGAGANPLPSSSSFLERQMNSYYGRAQYNYDNRYLLGVSLRADGASNFGANNKYGTFPSFSAGWNISNEKFFQQFAKTISLLKVRGSFGVVGNAELPSYVTQQHLSSGQTVFNNGTATDVTLTSVANPNLKWERAQQLDFGIEIGLLNNRISFTADYYNKVNKNLLYQLPLPESSGYPYVWDNIGSIRNRGIELSLTTLNINNQDVKWTTMVNFSMNRSKVTELYGSPIYPVGGIIEQGLPLNEFYGYVRENAFSNAADAQKYYQGNPAAVAGSLRYKDVNGNGYKDIGDRVPLGNAMPKFEVNMTNSFSYKGVTLFLDLESMYGLNLLNNTRHQMESSGPNINSYKEILNSWTPSNQNTKLPVLERYGEGVGPEVNDSFFVEDGTFLRVRNIGLSYRVNPAWLKNILLKNVSVGVNVENAFLFTKYSGFDPEYTSFDAKQNQGVDNYQYPKPRTISVTLNATF